MGAVRKSWGAVFWVNEPRFVSRNGPLSRPDRFVDLSSVRVLIWPNSLQFKRRKWQWCQLRNALLSNFRMEIDVTEKDSLVISQEKQLDQSKTTYLVLNY